jgi:hypothetical protein
MDRSDHEAVKQNLGFPGASRLAPDRSQAGIGARRMQMRNAPDLVVDSCLLQTPCRCFWTPRAEGILIPCYRLAHIALHEQG